MMNWTLNQQNRICFVMIDDTGTEISGLGGAGLTIEISKNGSAFASSAGTKSEIGDGWYSYLSTAAEADTHGPVAVKVTAVGAVQQNLLYVVENLQSEAIAFTYTVTDGVNPLDGVDIWITTDVAGNNVLWKGRTDALGVARDVNDKLPYLDPGTYYFWKQMGGYIDDQNPDVEVVS